MVEPITPFFINQSNVIVASCNDKYIPYLSVMLLSLQECTQDKKFYDIIILEYNVSFKNKEIIQNLIERKNIYLRFFNIEGVLPNEVLANITPYISKDMYSRILIPELCKQYQKALYIDIDIIFKIDPEDIFILLPHNFPIGVVKDLAQCIAYNRTSHIAEYFTDILPIDISRYFNSGVLLFDIPLWNKLEIVKELLLIDNSKFKWPDQDMFNKCFNNKDIYFMDYSFNFIFPRKPKEIKYLSKDLQNLYKNSLKDPKVIHYSSIEKPWLMPEKNRLHELWWKYAKKSPFLEVIIERLKEFNNFTTFEYNPLISLYHLSRIKLVDRFISYESKRYQKQLLLKQRIKKFCFRNNIN